MNGPADAAVDSDAAAPEAKPSGAAREGAAAAKSVPKRMTLNEEMYATLRWAMAPLRRAPWWLKVTLVCIAARLVSYAIFLGTAHHADESPWGGRQPDYLTYINRWDAGWYERIFNNGYPAAIPRDDNGNAFPNEWAFYPLFPLLARGLHAVTGLGWPASGAIVATLAGLAAMLMAYKLFRRYASPGTALWGVAFFAFFPVSAVLQVPYAESLGLFFLAAALYCLTGRNYWAAMVMVTLLCLSRPAGAPFAAAVAVHLLVRWWHRKADPVPARDYAAIILLGLLSALMAFFWMFAAWWYTGERTAYTDTETAWRGGGGLVLFEPWLEAAVKLVGPLWGPLILVLFVAAAALYFNSKAVRRIGPELLGFCVFYLLYLMAVLHPQSSTFRMLLPMFPLALAGALISTSKAYRWSVLVMFTLLQLVWVAWTWQWVALSHGDTYPP